MSLLRVANRIIIAANSGTGVRLTRQQVQELAAAMRDFVPNPPTHTMSVKERASAGANRVKQASKSTH